ncbi:MAG: FAD-dependent oxidoreductase [Steroidobacteraceae bacterium]
MNAVTDHAAGRAARNTDDTRPYRDTSYWLASAEDDLTPRKSLHGRCAVDVAILGGGYSGLWTAYYLLRDNPGIEVAILEKEICGFGASGRNGGWCSPRFPVDADALERRYGAETARDTLLALYDAVEEIGRVVNKENIDIEYRKTGLLGLARGNAQLPALRAAQQSYERLGLGEYNRLVSASEAFELVHASNVAGGLLTSAGAALHPAKLARGLARLVERLGGVIYERNEVIEISTGPRPSLTTSDGTLFARRAVIAAAEAYLTQVPNFERSVVPMSSMIVLTAPLTASQWSKIGWQGGQCLSSQSSTKNYLTRTTDGRVLYGSRGAPYHFGSAISDAALNGESIYEWMRATVREWFPVLEHVEFTHAWGGYLGVPRDWMPTVHFDEATKLGRLHGYTGRGVATSNLAGRLLAGLIGKRHTGLERLPLHRRRTPNWEVEPLRWAAVRYLQNAYARMDEAVAQGRSMPLDAAFAKFLGGQ